MLATCDHQDCIVVYDTPILASCPLCTMETELEGSEKKYENKIENLEEKIEWLKETYSEFKNAFKDLDDEKETKENAKKI